MKGWARFRKTPTGFIPADDDARALHAKVPVGQTALLRYERNRSTPQNDLYWAVLEHVAEATEWETKERLHAGIKLELGMYDLMKMPNGKVVPVLQSTSFADMKQGEFQTFFDNAMRLICTKVLPGYSAEALIEETRTEKGIAA